MTNKDYETLASSLVKLLGGKENISSYTNCISRFRVNVKNNEIVKIDDIIKTKNVIGIINKNNEVQIILGPNLIDKFSEEIKRQFPDLKYGGIVSPLKASKNLSEIAKENKEKQRAKNTSSVQAFMLKFGQIFMPLIFGFIGAGILSGIGGILQSIYTIPNLDNPTEIDWGNHYIAESWSNIFSTMLNLWRQAFIIIVGWRTAEVFGGVGVIGALSATLFVPIFGSIYTSSFIDVGPNGFIFLGMHIKDPTTNWLTIGFRPEIVYVSGFSDPSHIVGYTLDYASGGIFGGMILAGMSIPTVKTIRKYTPENMDFVIASTLTILFMIFLGYFLIIPISGILFEIVAWLFQTVSGNAFGASGLAFIFLVAVVFGVEQGFIPIYAALVDTQHMNSLFPILAMAGAGQVGAVMALYFKIDKNEDSALRNQIKGAIIPGFLGIGEPLIYGVSLPRPKVFLAAMFGAAVGGFYLGALSSWGGVTIGLNTMFGPSGLLGAPMMTAHFDSQPSMVVGHAGLAISLYISSLIITYISGFVALQIIGVKGVDLS